MQNRTTQLDSLTSLRFFAAAMVVVYHTLGTIWWPSDSLGTLRLNQGVSFFFVLSGFVLHLNYRRALEARELSYRDFMLRRWFRLWPTHVAALLLVVALAPAISFSAIFSEFTAWEIFEIVFMLHSLDPDIAIYYAINGPAWSISTEFLFYLTLPLLTALALRSPLLMLGGCVVWLSGYLMLTASLSLDENQLTGFIYISPFSRLLEFAFGVFICEQWVRSGSSGRSLDRRIATLAEVTCIAVVAGAMLATQPAADVASQLSGRTLGRYVEVAFAGPAFGLLIFVFAFQRGRISQLLSLRPFVLLGEISFALYLVHVTMLHWVGNMGWFGRLPVPVQVIVYATVCLATAWLVYRTIETAGIRLGKRLVAKLG